MRAHLPIRNSTGPRIGFNELLNHQQLVGDGVVLLKDGGLLGGFWYEGRDVEAANGADLEQIRRDLVDSFQCLGGNWMLHVDSFRRRDHSYIEGEFSEVVDLAIDEERLTDATFLRSYTAIFVTWLPPRLEQSGAGKMIKDAFSINEGVVAGEVLSALDAQLKHFEKTMLELSARLNRVVAVRRMRSHADNCELLQALNYQINGEWRPCRPPPRGMYLDTYLAHELFNQDDHLFQAERAVVAVTLIGYPTKGTYPGMTAALGSLGIEYRWSNRFIVLGYLGSRTFFGRLQKSWERMQRGFLAQITRNPNAPLNKDAVKRVAEVHHAQSSIEGQDEFYGHHTGTVILRGKTKEEALEHAKLVVDTFHRMGFTAYVEGQNGIEAVRGSYGGHGYENLRKPGITAENFADIIPIHREWTGEARSPNPFLPANSPPLLQAESRSGDLFHYNLHVGDVGHTLMLGPTGAGKSTLLALTASQFGRYPDAQVFAFDFGYSMLPLALAHEDSAHYALGGDGSNVRLTPLAAIDTVNDRAWACDWLRIVFDEQGIKLTPDQGAEVDQAIEDLAATTTDVADRSLTALLGFIQDAQLRAALRVYTKGAGASVLGGDSAQLRSARFMVFELSHLLKLKSPIYTPTLLYLFREIEKRLALGRPTLLILDEAWVALANSLFAPRVEEWLVTLRKLNCAVIIATQSLTQILRSPVRDAIFDSCATRILLPNPEASGESLRALYATHLRLRPEQIQLIAKARKKHDYYLMAEGKARMFRLKLGPVARSFVGASGPRDLERVRALHAEHGHRYVPLWLAERGLDQAAARCSELYVQQQQQRTRQVA